MWAYTPGPYLAADGFVASDGAAASGAVAVGFPVGDAGVSAAGGAVFSVGAGGTGSGAGVGAGVGAAAGGSDWRAGSWGAPQPAAANATAHTNPTIHLFIVDSS